MNIPSCPTLTTRIVAMTRSFIGGEEHDLGELDVVDAEYTGLWEKQRILRELHNTQSIMSTMPLEIITNIFLFVRQDPAKRKFRAFPGPLLIGQVCSAWRRIAWSFPMLWDTITIFFSEKKLKAQQSLLREWLERSGVCPLHLYLGGQRVKSQRTADRRAVVLTPVHFTLPQPIIDLLISYKERWATLDTFAFPYLARSIPGHTFPLLSSLRLYTSEEMILYGSMLSLDTHLKWDFDKNTPKLRSLVSIGPHCDIIKVDWERLHHVKVLCSIETCFSTLARCRALRTGSFNLKISLLPTLTTDTPASLYLTDLEFTNATSDLIINILIGVTAPKLESLRITFKQHATHQWIPALAGMLARSRCELTRLSLHDVNATEKDVNNTLRLLPSLTTLLIKRDKSTPTLSNKTFDALIPANDAMDTLLPNLTSFIFAGGVSFRLECMTDMLESRLSDIRGPGNLRIQKLASLDITYNNPDWSDKRKSLVKPFIDMTEDLAERGIKLKLVQKKHS